MKLSLVIPVLNQHEMAKACLSRILSNVSGEIEIVVIENGSDVPFTYEGIGWESVRVFRNIENIGVYPVYRQGMEKATGDIVAFFHDDVVVWEKGWDRRVISEFFNRQRLGLMGFIGSNEIDNLGGRGGGTASNFMGKELLSENKKWTGSPAEAHGRRITDYLNGAVVDGCVMIVRREAWNSISFREDFGLHHFYDKLVSCQILESGWEVGILGIEFDHFSGQTVAHEMKYEDTIEKWCKERNIPKNGDNWDQTVYKYSEKMWLTEYRDIKHLFPIMIK